jgi:hypothetical protein
VLASTPVSQSIQASVEVRKCPHGRGVFAKRDFKGGETIRTIDGITITTNPKSPPWKRWALIIGRTPEGKELFWDEEPEESEDYWSNFLDHDDHPNVRFVIDVAERRARLLTIRPLKAGEELFLNYKEYDSGNWAPG